MDPLSHSLSLSRILFLLEGHFALLVSSSQPPIGASHIYHSLKAALPRFSELWEIGCPKTRSSLFSRVAFQLCCLLGEPEGGDGQPRPLFPQI